jgi:hypothetical protein
MIPVRFFFFSFWGVIGLEGFRARSALHAEGGSVLFLSKQLVQEADPFKVGIFALQFAFVSR